MENLHVYVPTHTSVSKETIPGDDEEVDVTEDKFHHILCGGDQLTVAHARGCQRIRKN